MSKSKGEITRSLLSNIFAETGPELVLAYLLDKADESLIKLLYDQDYDQDPEGLPKLRQHVEPIISSEHWIEATHWHLEQERLVEEKLKTIKQACLNIANEYMRLNEPEHAYEFKESTEYEAICTECETIKQRKVARICVQGDIKRTRSSYRNFIYPKLDEIVELSDGRKVLQCRQRHDHSSIEYRASAKVITVQRKLSAEEKRGFIDEIVAALVSAVDPVVRNEKKGRLGYVRDMLVEGDRVGKMRDYIYERLNTLPSSAAPYSTFKSPYKGLWEIFGAYLRMNLNSKNWRVISGARLHPKIGEKLFGILDGYREALVPFMIFRYGTKSIERVQEKLTEILFGDEDEIINDFYRFRVIMRDYDSALQMRDFINNQVRRKRGPDVHPDIVDAKQRADYIKNPKDNNYQSAHYMFLTRDRKRIELQVRDHMMDFRAETYPKQAHAGYVDDIKERVSKLPKHYAALIKVVFDFYFPNRGA